MLKISKSNSVCHLLICSHNLLMFSNFQLISRCSMTIFKNFWLNLSCTFVNNGDSHPQNHHTLFCFLSNLPWVFILHIFSPARFCDFGITFCSVFLIISMACLVDFLFSLSLSVLNYFFSKCQIFKVYWIENWHLYPCCIS